jgi:hypothetical protein
VSTTAAAPRARQRWDERLRVETVVPLLVVFLVLTALYVWQASRREVPSIFTDELELTQLSRSIAETGLPARRGEPHGFTSLVPWLTAPAWWIGDVSTAYSTLKYVQALVMAATVLPAYLLARTVVSRPWALFAATATIAAPALSYSPIVVEEPFAYPAAATALWLTVRAVARPTWRTVAVALAACIVAAGIRSQLVALVPALLVPLLVRGWRTPRARRFRSTWSRWDWAGAVALAVGTVLLLMAVAGHLSGEWEVTMALWKGRIVEYGLFAFGAFTIGVGVLPVIALLAAPFRPREELRDPQTWAFALVSASAVASFAFYAGLKGAYISTVFGSFSVERNLIYLTPLAFAATALVLARRTISWWALAGATAVVVYLVVDTPMRLDQYPYYEAHGLAILAFANRVLVWPESTIQAWLVGIALGSGALLAAVALLRSWSRWALGLSLAVVAALLTWNLTNEVYAANGERRLSDQLADNFVADREWVDEAVGNGTVTIVGQQHVDPTAIWLTEFFNRSVTQVWSVDPSSPAPPPGPTETPDLVSPQGDLWPDPGTDYALAVNGVRLQGEVVEALPDDLTRLYRLDGPFRIAENQTGVFGDGWMGETAAYNRFAVADDGPGFARVTLSREAFCTDQPVPSRMTIRIGPVGTGADKQPALSSVTEERVVAVEPCQAQTILLRPPGVPWRVEVQAQTFVPAEVDPNLGDRRRLGARVGFGFVPV